VIALHGDVLSPIIRSPVRAVGFSARDNSLPRLANPSVPENASGAVRGRSPKMSPDGTGRARIPPQACGYFAACSGALTPQEAGLAAESEDPRGLKEHRDVANRDEVLN
jgi:hypothetical protein